MSACRQRSPPRAISALKPSTPHRSFQAAAKASSKRSESVGPIGDLPVGQEHAEVEDPGGLAQRPRDLVRVLVDDVDAHRLQDRQDARQRHGRADAGDLQPQVAAGAVRRLVDLQRELAGRESSIDERVVDAAGRRRSPPCRPPGTRTRTRAAAGAAAASPTRATSADWNSSCQLRVAAATARLEGGDVDVRAAPARRARGRRSAGGRASTPTTRAV